MPVAGVVEPAAFVSAPIKTAIEDAVFFGGVKELDDVLNIIVLDDEFPQRLRYGLEALRYFREQYGAGGVLEPKEQIAKQKAILMEHSWGAEILDMLRPLYQDSDQKLA